MLQRDGTVYEGYWKKGMATGYGLLIQKDGFKLYGLFKDNLLVKKLDLEEFLKENQSKKQKTPDKIKT